MTIVNQMYASGQGYLVKVLKKGSYTFQWEIQSTASNQYDPVHLDPLNGQHFRLQIAIMS